MPAEKRLADYLSNNLELVIHLGCHTMNYGLIVHESVVGDITFLVNGSEHKRYDIDELFWGLEMRYWGKTPESTGAQAKIQRVGEAGWRRAGHA